MEAKQETR